MPKIAPKRPPRWNCASGSGIGIAKDAPTSRHSTASTAAWKDEEMVVREEEIMVRGEKMVVREEVKVVRGG